MPTPPLLSFEELLEPIPGDNPAGDSVPFTLRQQLEEYRKEINPALFDEDDPRRPTEFKRAEWDSIVDLGTKILKETSKDLLVSARLTEALTKEHSFAGLRDGLHLMRELVTTCWDRLNPTIEDGDLEVRAAAFNWLDDPNWGARFPTSLRLLPLVVNGETKISWHDWKQLQEGKGSLTGEDFEKTVMFTPRPHCQNLLEDLEQAREELGQLAQSLNNQLGEFAPSFLEISKALNDCRTLAQQILERKGPPEGEEPAEEKEAEPTGEELPGEGLETGAPTVPEKAARKPRTREEIYRQLTEAAIMLQRLEPHSPIPYLINKAVELGAMPFPLLMRALIRDANVISEMNRELGIKQEGGAEENVSEEE